MKTYFFRRLNSAAALEKIAADYPGDRDAEDFIRFVRNSKRGIMPGNPELCRLAAGIKENAS